MTEKETEFFPDGEPQELQNGEPVAPKGKTFLQKISAMAGLTAVAQLIELTVPNPAQAGDGKTFNLKPDTPPEKFVEWQGASSPSLAIEANYKIRGRILEIVTTTNAPVFLHGACPPEDLYPGWKLDIPGADETDGGEVKKDGGTKKKQGYPAEVHAMDVLRTGPDGTWTVATTASPRLGKTVKTTLTCKKGEDSHKLTLFITSQGDGGSNGAGNYFTFSGEGSESGDDDTDSSKKGHRVKMEAGALGVAPLQGVPKDENLWNPGAGARLSFDPINSTRDGVKRFLLGIDYRFGYGIPDGTVPDANTHTITGRFGWDPVLYDEAARIVLDVGVGAGVGVTQPSIKRNGEEIPGSTNVVGTADIGLEVGGDNVRGKIGAFCTISEDPAQQACGVNAGPVIEF